MLTPSLKSVVFSGLIFMAALEAFGAEEQKGIPAPQILLNDVFIQPTLRASEGGRGGIEALKWSLGAKSNFASWVDVQITAGSGSLLYLPYWNPNSVSNSVAVLDAYATLHTFLGDIYAGETLVPWGLQGQSKESDLWLPRDLLYQNGAFPLRDLGAGIKTESNGLYMNVMAHNGDGGPYGDQDNRMFLTGQWGVMGAGNTNLGLSLTAGRVAAPLITNEIHVRGGNLFFGFNIFGLGLQLEGSYLQSISSIQTVDTLAWHGDLEHPITSHINFIGRFEQYNPNTRVTSNVTTQVYAGGEFHSKNNASRLFMFFENTQQTIPGTSQQSVDQFVMMWRVNPPLE